MKIKSFLSLALAVVMVLSLSVGVYADTSVNVDGGEGTTDLILEAQATRMICTVPTALLVSVDEDGVATCASNAKIVNGSYGAVKVSNLAIATTSAYQFVDFATNMNLQKVDSKKIGLKINDETTTGADAITFDQANWGQIAGTDGAEGGDDELAIKYDAKV